MSAALALFALTVPAILLMTVWAGVTAFRLLFPEDSLPLDPAARRQRATRRGQSVPVRLKDILEDQQARHAVSSGGAAPDGRSGHPLFDDLWLRRN